MRFCFTSIYSDKPNFEMMRIIAVFSSLLNISKQTHGSVRSNIWEGFGILLNKLYYILFVFYGKKWLKLMPKLKPRETK